MNPIESPIPVLIHGVGGNLGTPIIKYALMNPRLRVNVMMRDPNSEPELKKKVEAAGGKVIKADLEDRSTLKDITKGMHTVICTISSKHGNCCLDGQMALIDDCVKNNVKLYVPSAFGFNIDALDKDTLLECPKTAYKVKIDEYLKKVGLKSLTINVGVIMEYLFKILKENRSYYGDEDFKLDLTSFDNAARLTVEAIARQNLSGKYCYRGGSYSMKDIQDTYSKVRKDNIQLKRAGSLEDLDKEIFSRRKEKEDKSVARLQFMKMMFDKRSKFTTVNNKDFEDVKTMSLEEFLRENNEITL